MPRGSLAAPAASSAGQGIADERALAAPGMPTVGAAAFAETPVKVRRGRLRDLDALVALENAVFVSDILSRRSFRRFLAVADATLVIAEEHRALAGYALVVYPARSDLARLYSIAVAPRNEGHGVGLRLLLAAERSARRHGRHAMRLEVNERNSRAIARYVKSGYRLFGRLHDYYGDHADALRFEKPLAGSINPA